MSDHIPTSEVLNRAADLIEERGWTTGSGWFDGGPTRPLCAEGAIRVAAREGGSHWTAIEAVARHLSLPRLIKFHDIPDSKGWWTPYVWVWNDHEPASGSDVVEVLRATALIESAREREAAEVSA